MPCGNGLLRDNFNRLFVPLIGSRRGQVFNQLRTIAFKLKTNVDNSNLKILSTAQRKGCACSGSLFLCFSHKFFLSIRCLRRGFAIAAITLRRSAQFTGEFVEAL